MANTRYEEVMVELQTPRLFSYNFPQKTERQSREALLKNRPKFERFSHWILVIYVGACYRISILLCSFNKLRIPRASLPCRTNCMYHEALLSI